MPTELTAAPKYSVILADPPWEYHVYNANTPRSKKPRAGWRGVATIHYQTMPPEEIQALPVKEMAARNAALFLWSTMPCLPQALELMETWGFKYRCVAFTWIKTNQSGRVHMGLGHYTRGNAELCLLGIRGRMRRLAPDVEQVIVASRREHSRKPDETYGRIERLFSGPYLELFARQRWPGWETAFSNQTETFAAQTPLVSEVSRAARLVVGL